MKKFFGILLAATLAFGVVGCGSTTTDEDTNSTETAAEGTTIKVGASPSPHAEILYAAQPLLAEQGITLEVVEFND